MNYNTMLLIIMFLSIVYNFMIILSESKENSKNKNIIKSEIKKWEANTTIIVKIIIWGLLIFLLVRVKNLLYLYSFLYYMILLLIYSFLLIKILIQKENEKITESELGYLALIPGIFSILYKTKISQAALNFLHNKYGSTTIFFIIKNTTKYFIVIFFLTIITFLILLKLKKIIHINKKLKYFDFNSNEYIYNNCRNKKGIIEYLKDIIILINNMLKSSLEKYILVPFIFIFRIFYKFLKKLTKEFSLYVIIIKTFNISLIISLIITYYKLLCDYNEDVLTELYAVVITTIIIPIILNIISDLKETKE